MCRGGTATTGNRSRRRRIEHLPNCPVLEPLWGSFLKLAGLKLPDSIARKRLLLLGLSNPPLPQSLSDLHLILWKFTLIHFTLVDLQKKPFKTDDVWLSAVRRYASKANKLTHHIRSKQMRAEATNAALDLQPERRSLEPLATIDDDGAIDWNPTMCRYIERADAGVGAKS